MKPIITYFPSVTHDQNITVLIFDVKTQLLYLLENKSLMRKRNFCKDCYIWTGKPIGEVTHIGSAHTGWS